MNIAVSGQQPVILDITAGLHKVKRSAFGLKAFHRVIVCR
jgi:hypothetical protein